MRFFLRFIVIIACSSMLIGWSFGTGKPKKSDIENEFKERMPEYLQLSSFDVDIIENLGNKFDPRWGSRFKAVVKTNIPLYEHDEKQEAQKNRHIYEPVIYLILKTKKNTKIDIYGKAVSVRFKDKWKTDIDLDERIDIGKSLRKIKKDLEDKIVIIRGSKEEKELRKNLSHVPKTLIGTWRGWTGHKDLTTFILTALNQEYNLKIVSRPGETSGVWRVPNTNSASRNYYIIVEALNAENKPVQVAVSSEESGKTTMVSKWGIRVNETVFKSIGADKQDDGIIQKNIFGEKKKGYLVPEYRFSTTGAAITSW